MPWNEGSKAKSKTTNTKPKGSLQDIARNGELESIFPTRLPRLELETPVKKVFRI